MWVRCDWVFVCDSACSSGRLHSGDSGVCINHRAVRFRNHHTLWVSGVKIDCGERLKAISLFYDFITHNIYISVALFLISIVRLILWTCLSLQS